MIAIIDFGSQYTQLIARRVRECRVYSEIFSCRTPLERIMALNPEGVILSGGPASVNDSDQSRFRSLFERRIPVLGICYGLQLGAHLLGGTVRRSAHREYGPALVRIRPSPVFHGLPHEFRVWMSHGDSIVRLPRGARTIAFTKATPVAGFEYRNFIGLQFHPEVHHTIGGKRIIDNFLTRVCRVPKTWTMDRFIAEKTAQIAAAASGGRVICAISGGVDSTVAAALCTRALGKDVVGIFVDNGLLRLNERQDVERNLRKRINLRIVDASTRFISALHGIRDPERKRKVIGRTFIRVFEREAQRVRNARFLVQGTLYPDVIESGMGIGPAAVIKTHHNVGGLPRRMKLDVLEPLRMLFKDEVRVLGRRLGLPERFIDRKPFPGPGLAVRILGPITRQRLDLLRQADHILLEEAVRLRAYPAIWQIFAVLLPLGSVGVMGDQRTYDSVIALRAVRSEDGMTADWVRLPHDFLARVSRRLTNEIKGVNRVVFDITSKPPATIEWE